MSKSAQLAKLTKQRNTLLHELVKVENRIEARRGIFNRNPATVDEKNRVRNLKRKIHTVEQRMAALNP